MIEWVPTLNNVVLNVATPLASVTWPICVAPSRNVTLPVGTVAVPAELNTIASNNTDWLRTEGFGEENSIVVVALDTTCVTVVEVLGAKFVSPTY